MYDILPLQMLARGTVAEVACILGEPAEAGRLEELGLRVGARIEMVTAGSPCIVRLDGSKLCFRQTEAARVMVREIGAAVSSATVFEMHR